MTKKQFPSNDEYYAKILFDFGAKTCVVTDLLGINSHKATNYYRAFYPDRKNSLRRSINDPTKLSITNQDRLNTHLFLVIYNYILKHSKPDTYAVDLFLQTFNMYVDKSNQEIFKKKYDINICHFIFRIQNSRIALTQTNCKHCESPFYHTDNDLNPICPVCTISSQICCIQCGKEVIQTSNEGTLTKKKKTLCDDCTREKYKQRSKQWYKKTSAVNLFTIFE